MEQNYEENDPVIAAKKKLALFIAGGITLLIFGGWIFYFKGVLKENLKQTKEEVALFDELKQNTGESWDNIKKVFEEIGNKVEENKKVYNEGQSATSTATTTDEMTIMETSTTTATTTNSIKSE